ncbi:ATP-binding cassette domain-containing protein [Salinispora vitiensis]|uniref:ATP-binding cassette domain-containing protein n=2 Tax=Salinispora vitiensis TaxID=999544 RepID=UPI0003A17B5A|nr:ATP-binding cassette domain-containing protein [Salinispora vitiensis]
MTSLMANNLCQGYGRKQVVHDFTHDFSPGIVGLLGPNGAGKTTLLNTLALLKPPTSGSISLGGERVADVKSVRRMRRRVGFQPQNFPYPGGLTVTDFLRYAAWLREFPRNRTPAAVATAIERLDLQEYAKAKLRTLSGGTLQRVGVAQAIVHDPEVVILDEPTVGLDPAQRVSLRSQLRESARSRLVLISTHIVDDVLHTCDSVLVFLQGRVVFDGSPAELANAGDASAATEGMSAIESGYLQLATKAGVSA